MTYTKTVELPVPPDVAFELLTDPDRLRRWQVVSAYVELRAGGEYRWTVIPGQVAAGRYRDLGRLVALATRGDAGPDEWARG